MAEPGPLPRETAIPIITGRSIPFDLRAGAYVIDLVTAELSTGRFRVLVGLDDGNVHAFDLIVIR